jgi:hypothetical protein
MKRIHIVIIAVTSTLFFAGSLKAQSVFIPDPVFKSYLLSDPSINLDLDTAIDVTEAQAYTGGFNLTSAGVSDLTGIASFTNLTTLFADNNNLTSLDLTANHQLTQVYAGTNSLTSINVFGDSALFFLECSSNLLTSIDVSSNINLQTLDVQSNQLTTLNIANNPWLYNIYCQFNSLTNLDLTNHYSLSALYCDANQLTTLDVSTNSSLQNVTCTGNPLTCLNFGSNYFLTNLDCSHNTLLTKLNLKNGNNFGLTFIDATSCPALVCIQVDDTAYANASWSGYKDPTAYFSNDCGQPTAIFDNTPPGCFGTPIVFDQTCANNDSFIWYFGDGDTTTVMNDPTHNYLTGGNFYVQLFAKSCYGTAMADTSIQIGYDIHGYIDYSGGAFGDGNVILLRYEPFYTSFDTAAIYWGFEVAGFYSFSNVIDGFYQIKVFPDTTILPNVIPTYSGNTSNWESAFTINHGCFNVDTMNITLLEVSPTGIGPGALSGEIIEGAGFGRAQGDPIHGVDVKLGITGSAQVYDCTTTDTLGQYFFANLPLGDYTIYVEIPGLLKDSSYTLTIDSTNLVWTYLDYLVDSNSIDIIGNIGFETVEDDIIGKFFIYPNPIRDNATIQYKIGSDAEVKIDVYNIYGVKVQSLLNMSNESGEYSLSFNPKLANLKSGIYFVSLSVGNKVKTIRIVVME